MIAYYVHHQGTGHRQRAASVASEMRLPVTGLSSLGPPSNWTGRWIRLADDAAGADWETADVTAGGTFHWLPRHDLGLRQRMGAVSSLLAGGQIRCLVSDVSVEVAVLARLHGVPVVVMAQPGDRTDRAHRLAYDMADLLLAPWPCHPERPWPASWLAKTTHLGGFSRYDGRTPSPDRLPGRRVLVFWGSGGIDVGPPQLFSAATATPDWSWRVAGTSPTFSGLPVPSNLTQLGWVEDLWPELCRADVVVTHAGQNAIAEVAAARRPAVVIPQRRPFGEQLATADALRISGLATVIDRWADAASWPAVLKKAAAYDPQGWTRWSTGGGARRAARQIETLVGEPGR